MAQNDDITVHVVKRKGLNLYLRYTDPVDGRRHEKNSGTRSMKCAQRAAGVWQAELNADGFVTERITEWEEFREDFFDNYVAERSRSYSRTISSTFNVIDELMRPDKLNRITTQWIKRFRTIARKQGRSPATLHKYMQHLRTALKWAHDQDYLKAVPKFPTEQRKANKGKKLMKGRPITLEEFDRMMDATRGTLKSPRKPTENQLQAIDAAERALKHLIEGLWLSGLRLGEALSLTWDQWADGIRVETDPDGDMFLLIDGTDQKSGEPQLYPVVDDFADFLLQTPEEDRTGFVFSPFRTRGIVSRRVDSVSDWIVAIGRKAGVKVDTRRNRRTGKDEPVYASAHDLRRSFGFRWALVVESLVLRDLMRHSSVETTEQYYVGVQAKRMLKHIRSRTRAAEVNGDGRRWNERLPDQQKSEATGETRTHDLSFTKASLCQLSYGGVCANCFDTPGAAEVSSSVPVIARAAARPCWRGFRFQLTRLVGARTPRGHTPD